MDGVSSKNRGALQRIARQAMTERGLLPDFFPDALTELAGIIAPVLSTEVPLRDLKNFLWCSIDNDDSRDLDQITVAAPMPGNRVKIYFAISNVDTIVKKGSAIEIMRYIIPRRSTLPGPSFRCRPSVFPTISHRLTLVQSALRSS
jgi:hypothetical protein